MEKKGKFDYILLETTGLADPGKMRFAEFNKYQLSYKSVFHCYRTLFFQAMAWGAYRELFASCEYSWSHQLFHQEACVG